MRVLAVAVAALVLAGCGGSEAKPPAKADTAVRGDSYTVTVKPAGPNGHWVKLFLSPDLKTYLGQWSGECEVQTTYFIPARGGKPRPVTGRAGDESIALGWSGHRARVLIPRAVCGSQFETAGIYSIDPRGGPPKLLRRLKSRLGGA